MGEDGAAAIYALGDLATVQMSNPGHRGYIIFDGKYEDYLAGFGQLADRFFCPRDKRFADAEGFDVRLDNKAVIDE